MTFIPQNDPLLRQFFDIVAANRPIAEQERVMSD